MQKSGFEWPLISEADQERELERTVEAVLFSGQVTDSATANTTRAQYLATHP